MNAQLGEWNHSTSENRKVVVYGCGRWGKVMIEKLQNYDVRIVCIVDKMQAGGTYLSYPIIRIEELNRYDFEDVIIASVDYADEIRDILHEFELKNSKEFKTHNIII